MKTTTKLWIGIAILILLSPIGLLLPEHFKAGDAWGEWDINKIKEMVGYIPQELEKLSSLWSAPIPDYTFKGWEEKHIASLSIAYILSAIIGTLTCIGVIFLLAKKLVKK